MPLYQSPEYGDLYVEYNVVLPSEISPETKKRTCSRHVEPYLETDCPHQACFLPSTPTAKRARTPRTSYRVTGL